MRFEDALRDHQERRQDGILLDAPALAPSSLPPGWRAEDVLADGSRGFLPLRQAADAMSATEDDVLELARQGLLLAELRGSALYVEPAIVSLTSVDHRRENASSGAH